MKKRQQSIRNFEKARLSKKACLKAKGGHKYSPTGAGYQGTFIWETVDVRGFLNRDLDTMHNFQSSLSGSGR